MEKLVWLVTGCSSGFGELFVRQILSRGDLVIATGRQLQRIKHLEQAGAAILELDVTHSQQSLATIITKAIAIYGRLDVLVNNAAYIAAGACEDIDYEQILAQFETNVFGVLKVTRAALPHMRERRTGTLVFIGSRSGWWGDPYVGPYTASKFALEGLVECLSRETESFGIRTLLIEPGRFRTMILSPENLQIVQSSIPDYVQASKTFATGLAQEDRTQPGDTHRAVKIIVDLVRGEGCAEGKDLPFRLPLGTDCYDTIKEKCEETLHLLEEWKGIINSTNHQD
ncbi:NAD(P)-binding protein [Whalleya microplaca]|nr:NAD(P)-binding protein [Whalleya microplaca]